MGRGLNLSEREKGKLDAYLAMHLSLREIARRMRRSPKVVKSYQQQRSSYGSNYKGRPKALSSRGRRLLIRKASNSTKSSSALKSELNLTISKSTICRELKQASLRRQKIKRQPYLTNAHKETRLEFCRHNMQRNFSSVWFSDEKKWYLDGPDNMSFYWHDLRKEERWGVKRQAGGGGLMIWGAICDASKSTLSISEGNINSEKYQDILRSHLMPFWSPDKVFMQDNASIHKSQSTMTWLQNHNVNILEWPSRSPDLNPIENVWGWMVRDVYKDSKQYNSLQSLKQAIHKSWNSLPAELLKIFTKSMPSRVFECIQARGGMTKY